MFSPDHFLWMGIVVIVVLLLTFISTKFKWSFKTATTVILVIYILAEVFKIITHVFPASKWLGEGATIDNFDASSEMGARYYLPKSLPFQLCSSMIFLVFYLRFGKNEERLQTVKNFLVYIFLVAASLAVLLGTCLNANNTANFLDSFKDPECGPIQFFLYHGGMIWYGVWLVKNKQVQFGMKQFLTNLAFVGIMVVLAIYINSVLIVYKTNFMFVVAPPAKGIPLLNLNHGWHAYMAHYLFILALVTFLFELPGIIIEKKKKKAIEAKAN